MEDYEYTLRMAAVRTEAYVAECQLEIARLVKEINRMHPKNRHEELLKKKNELKVQEKFLQIECWKVDLEDIREKIKQFT